MNDVQTGDQNAEHVEEVKADAAEAASDEAETEGDAAETGEGDGSGDGSQEGAEAEAEEGSGDTSPEAQAAATAARAGAQQRYDDALAKLKQISEGKLETGKEDSKFKDPDYRPESYDEIAEEASRRMEARAAAKEAAQGELRKAAEGLIDAQYAEIKAKDPSVTKERLIELADKYGFNDLYKAHELHREVQGKTDKAVKRTVDNTTKRKVESVSGGGKAPAPAPGGMSYQAIRQSHDVHDAVQRYLGK